MNAEELEFQICQYLDGALPPEQRPALEALLATDETARQLLTEHRKLDEAMKAAPLPQLPWDQLADRFAKAVAGDAEQLEQAFVQYVDGDLPAEQSKALEQRLAADPHGSSLLRQHRTLLGGLRSMPLPRIRWKNLSEHLTDAVADLADPKPIKLFGPWVRTVAGLAMAACVLLVTSLALHDHLTGHRAPGSVSMRPQPISDVAIGTNIPGPSGRAVTDIDVSAGTGASSADSAEYADGIVVVQPSRSLIATSASPVQDTLMPY